MAGSTAWRDIELAVQVVGQMRAEGWRSQTLVARRERGVELEFARAWVRAGGATEEGDPLTELASPGIDYLIAFVHDRADYAAQCALRAHRACWPPVRPYWRRGQWPVAPSPPRGIATPVPASKYI